VLDGERRLGHALERRHDLRQALDHRHVVGLEHAVVAVAEAGDDAGQGGDDRRIHVRAAGQPVDVPQRRVVPARAVQGGGLQHRGLGVGQRAAGQLIAGPGGAEVLEDQGEGRGRRVDPGEMGLRGDDAHRRGQLAVEAHLPAIEIESRARGPAGRIGGGELADHAGRGRGRRAVIGHGQPEAVADQAVAHRGDRQARDLARRQGAGRAQCGGHPGGVDLLDGGGDGRLGHGVSPGPPVDVELPLAMRLAPTGLEHRPRGGNHLSDGHVTEPQPKRRNLFARNDEPL
jgi:hypothetical protein